MELIAYLLVNAKQKYGIEKYHWEPTPVKREGAITIQDTKQFVDQVNKRVGREGADFSVCFDIGHTTNPELNEYNQNPLNWMKELSSDISMVHLQQTDGYLDRHFPFTEAYNERGVIHSEDVLDELPANVDYLFLEIGHPFEENDEQVLIELKESVDYWKNALTKRGWKNE